MPLFEMSGESLVPIEQTNFAVEKELQTLVEKNLAAVFNCRFVASEFLTGALHAGRIDSLALSEDNNPVIVHHSIYEYFPSGDRSRQTFPAFLIGPPNTRPLTIVTSVGHIESGIFIGDANDGGGRSKQFFIMRRHARLHTIEFRSGIKKPSCSAGRKPVTRMAPCENT